MTTYDCLWSMSGEKKSFGFKNAFFFRIWCSKTVVLDSVRLPAREVTHNDVRFWITKCHLQEHSELGLKEMVVFYFHTELHWNSEIMLFNNIHNTQYSTNWIMLVNILPFPNIHFLPDLASCVWVILIHFEDCQFTIWSSFGCSAV